MDVYYGCWDYILSSKTLGSRILTHGQCTHARLGPTRYKCTHSTSTHMTRGCGRVPHIHPRTRRAAHPHVRVKQHARNAPDSSLKITQGSRRKMRPAVRESGVYERPCKAARGVRVIGRPRTFRRPKNRPYPRGPIGESNPTASSHTGDGAPVRARIKAVSVHTRCAWRPGGEDRRRGAESLSLRAMPPPGRHRQRAVHCHTWMKCQGNERTEPVQAPTFPNTLGSGASSRRTADRHPVGVNNRVSRNSKRSLLP